MCSQKQLVTLLSLSTRLYREGDNQIVSGPPVALFTTLFLPTKNVNGGRSLIFTGAKVKGNNDLRSTYMNCVS